jgi:myo-inositol-1(or 4)-monophosphatase
MIDQSFVEQVHALVQQVGNFQIEHQGKVLEMPIEDKSLHNFVTYVDKKSEELLIEGLQKLLPEAVFLAEESGGNLDHEKPSWIVDPLDGTTNYIHQIPIFSISVALWNKGKLEFGAVYHPHAREFFYAISNQGAFLNDIPIQVTQAQKLSDALWATGFPTHDFPLLDNYLEIIRYSIQHTHGLRRLGSAAIDLAWVAAGRLDGFFEYGLSPWDVAAGALLVQEAGGIISDFSGKDNFLMGKEIVACNPLLHPLFIEQLNKFLCS